MSHYKEEQQRVNVVIEKVDGELRELDGRVGSVKSEIVSIRKNFWEDVKVNIDNIKEAVETAASIRQEAELLAEREHTHRHTINEYNLLTKIKETPYFGRIDFKEDNEVDTDEMYIGIGSFYDKENDEFLVYDWRAPISSLYYDYTLGRAQYKAPIGTIAGDLLLKRQYMIRNGTIQSMFDTGVTIGDELLQEALGRNASEQMKSIVATIQREQNQIIRNDKSDMLIVQGTAGSGKTSAALQRVAYLLYRYRGMVHADQMVLFSPNELFNSYIANVLPELGEENMQQTTFQAYVEHMIGKSFTVEDSFVQLEYVLTKKYESTYETRMKGIQYKSSVAFMELLEKYARSLSEKGLQFHDVTCKGEVLIEAKSICAYFYSLDMTIAIPNRMQLTMEWVLRKLHEFEKIEAKKDWIEREVQYLNKEDYNRIYEKIEKDNQFDYYEKEHALLTKYVVKKHFRSLRRKVKKFAFVNHPAIFEQLFESMQKDIFVPDCWEDICKQTVKCLKNKQLANEDATPYLFLKELLEGFKTNHLVKFVFIDEVQDYTPFQLAFLKRLFPKAKWTLLGDSNQNIFSHDQNKENNIIPTLFADRKVETVLLNRSYRSTKPIIEFTRCMIPNGKDIEAFNRDGKKPVCIKVIDEREHVENMILKVKELEEKGHKTIAVICKTNEECMKVRELIGDTLHVHLMQKENTTYEKGVVIIPAYLAKGIEFDAVIIFDASNNSYYRESERNLFYTACTRAMHELYVYYAGKLTEFLAHVPEELYKGEILNGESI
ncbi:AAA family ATPase [Bacillus tropicus]|uniref:RNA polymerase recycling motor HelD n=1 Tax=Bacillus tropicus TaxID=2026188 RepID=UPI000CD903D6|nr:MULTISPECIES: RNA polymerase recycling motor HelD [Bacillus cereus group]MCC2336994.1 AAA family ATPase [Bacillus tropicus]MCU5421102.1 AAA family ATPase [Bacillus tropicus]